MSDPYHDRYRNELRRYQAWFCVVLAGCASLTAIFAILTSLPMLRGAALILAVASLPLIFLSLRPRDGQGRPALLTGIGSLACAWALACTALLTPGFGFGLEPELTGKAAMATLAQVDNSLANTEDPEATAILRHIAAAEDEPSATTFRTLVPYLDNLATNILYKGEVREVASAVREVLESDPELYLHSLHEEAKAMAALIPPGDVVPEAVSVQVAQRLEQSLKNLIHAHSEQKIAGSFDIPSVGFNIRVAQLDDDGEPVLDEHGEPLISNREIGITYPYAGYSGGDVVFADPNSVTELLRELREDLHY